MSAQRTRKPPRLTPAPSSPRHVSRLALAVCLLIAACAAAFWSWRQTLQTTPSAYRAGLAAQQAGNPVLAEQDWLRAERDAPNSPNAFAALGDLDMQEHRFSDALTQYQAAAKIRPDDGTAYLRISRAQTALDNTSAAYQAAQRAAALRADDPDAQGLCGLLALREGDKGAALNDLRRAVALRPGDGDYTLPLVRLQMEQLDFAGAERTLTPYLQTHPGDPEACFLMATLIDLKPHTPANIAAALADAQKALAGLPGDRRVLSLLGQIDLDAGQPARALAAYRAGLRAAPHSEEMLHGLMTAYTRLGQLQQAAQAAASLAAATALRQRIMALTDQTKLDPANVPAGLTLVHLETQAGDLAAAYHYLTLLVRKNPTDMRPRRALAAFYRAQGRPDLASQALVPGFSP